MLLNGYANYELTYKEFMEKFYTAHYKASVQKVRGTQGNAD